MENCPDQREVGVIVSLVDNESMPPLSRPQRYSPGSCPWNPETSHVTGPYVIPTVATLLAICVESCRWWDITAIGSSDEEMRCGNAVGPSAGSPRGPP